MGPSALSGHQIEVPASGLAALSLEPVQGALIDGTGQLFLGHSMCGPRQQAVVIIYTGVIGITGNSLWWGTGTVKELELMSWVQFFA